ncbi:MAG: hypothetical protein PPP58_11230 [Natronomonas sp.]
MNGSRALLLAVVVCVAPFAAIPIADGDQTREVSDRLPSVADEDADATPETGPAETPSTTPVVPESGTTEYLALPPAEREVVVFGRGSLDVGTAVGGNTGQARAVYIRDRLDRDLTAAATESERRSALNRAIDRTDERLSALEATHREAMEALVDGEITADRYVRRSAAIDREARQLQAVIDRMADLEEIVDSETVARLDTRTNVLHGPVRDRAVEAVDGNADPVRVYVETADEAIVLATVEGGVDPTYLREAHQPANRQPSAEDQFGGDDRLVLDRLGELYPWTLENSEGIAIEGTISRAAGVYQTAVTHDHGELTAHFDGGTTDVFWEVQQKSLRAVPTTTQTTQTGQLELRVNTTRSGGPVSVEVLDTTGEGVPASISIDDEPVGTTDGERPLWTVAPRGELTVTAVHDGEEITLTTTLE